MKTLALGQTQLDEQNKTGAVVEDDKLRRSIKKTEKETATLKARAMRILMSDSERYTILHGGEPTTFELFPEVTVFCKISLKRMPPPLKFRIVYMKNKDLDLYHSSKYKEPGEGATDKHLFSPDKFVVEGHTQGKKVLFRQGDWLYLSLTSEKGCTFKILALFSGQTIKLEGQQINAK